MNTGRQSTHSPVNHQRTAHRGTWTPGTGTPGTGHPSPGHHGAVRIEQPFVLGSEKADLVETDLENLHSTAPEVRVSTLLTKFEKEFANEFRVLQLLHLHPSTYYGRAAQSFFDPIRERYYIADHRSLFFHSLAVAETASHLATALTKKGLLTPSEEHEVVARCLLHEALTPFRLPVLRSTEEGQDAPLPAGELNHRIEVALQRKFGFSKKDATALVHEVDAKCGEDLSSWGTLVSVSGEHEVTVSCDLVSAVVRLAESLVFSFGPESALKGRHFLFAPAHRALLQSSASSLSAASGPADILEGMVLANLKGELSRTTATVPPLDHLMLGTAFAVMTGVGDALCRGWTQLMGCAVSNPPAAAVLEQLRAPLAKPQRGFWRLVA